MRTTYEQGKRDKVIRVTIKLSWYELQNVLLGLQIDPTTPEAKLILRLFQTALDNCDEPA